MSQVNPAIPDASTEVRDKMLRFKQGGPSVEEAKAAMLAAKEVATTYKGGTRVPTFIQNNSGQTNTTSVSNPVQDLIISGRDKLSKAGFRPGMRVNAVEVVKANIITQAEADAILGKTSSATTVTEPVVEEPVAEPVVQSARVPQAPPVPTSAIEPTVSVQEPATDKKFHQEDKNFIVDVFREGREWIAELSYKNGSGTERFSASSKDDLMVKLAVGKANATLKVRDTVRRMRLGDKPDSWDFFYQQVKESHDLTPEQYTALPEASRGLILDLIQAQQILAFKEAHPEYYATQKNFQTVADYLNHREWPLTLHNLELAYSDLLEDGLIEVRTSAPAPVVPPAPAPVAITVPAPPVASDTEDSVSAVVTPPVVSTTVEPTPTAPVVRKKVLTGMVPGSSSAAPSGATQTAKTEEDTTSEELSVEKLRKMPMSQLKPIATRGRNPHRIY